MEIDVFFQPIAIEYNPTNDTLGEKIDYYHVEGDFPTLAKSVKLAIIGVNEWRGSEVEYTNKATADKVRERLYRLYDYFNCKDEIVDLGNIIPGNTYADTCYALKNSCEVLLKKGIIPIVIGGSHDLLYSVYSGYEGLEQNVNITNVDSSVDLVLDADESMPKNRTYLNQIILHQPGFLFNYSHIAYQTYYVNRNILELMTQMYFDYYRLGEIKGDITLAEPVVRDADIFSIDFSAIHNGQSSAINSGPNGLNGEDICQLSRYAGMSDKVSSFCVFELMMKESASYDSAAELAAQTIWYFLDGFYNRKGDFPKGKKSEYIKYRVSIRDFEHELIFYKSNKTDRWWIEVPFPSDLRNRYSRHQMIPCTYQDYVEATRNEIPDRWLKAYLKLSE
jgi:formiminoglutamase